MTAAAEEDDLWLGGKEEVLVRVGRTREKCLFAPLS